MRIHNDTIFALDISHWKRSAIRSCFPGRSVRFVKRFDVVPDGALLAVWGIKALPDLDRRGIQVVRIEDGFLRSVGLGADLIPPLSLVVDYRGIYFDARQPSDLEVILATTSFSDELIARAAGFRARVVEAGLTKYNTGRGSWTRAGKQQRVILVPGQVETDASLAFGAPGVHTNQALLKAVRLANPDAFVIYKPHPDVVAGLRHMGEGEQQTAWWCDLTLRDMPMAPLLEQVDEVHVMTSLTGFEALLRGKKVTCYGQPFYAGWGLTVDVLPLGRRQRQLSLDALVAGALLLYPRYLDASREALISPEFALEILLRKKAQHSNLFDWCLPAYRAFLRLAVGVR